MAQKALAAVKNFMSKIPFKAPWEVGALHSTVRPESWLDKANIVFCLQATGVASSAEYRDYLHKATEYRVHAPG